MSDDKFPFECSDWPAGSQRSEGVIPTPDRSVRVGVIRYEDMWTAPPRAFAVRSALLFALSMSVIYTDDEADDGDEEAVEAIEPSFISIPEANAPPGLSATSREQLDQTYLDCVNASEFSQWRVSRQRISLSRLHTENIFGI